MLPFIRKSVNYQIHAIQWINEKPMLAVLGQLPNGTGVLYIYRLAKNELVPEHGNCQFIDMPTAMNTLGNDLIIAESNKLSIWDVQDLTVPKRTIPLNGHHVQCMDCFGGSATQKGPPEIVVGGDNRVLIYDIRQDMPVVEITEKMQPWTVAFGNAGDEVHRNIAVGFAQGSIKLYDLAQKACIWEINVGIGVCCIEFDVKNEFQNKLTAGCLRGVFHVFNLSDMENVVQVTKENKDDPATIWTLGHSPHYRDGIIVCINNAMQLFHYSKTDKAKGTIKLVDCLAHMSEQPIRVFQFNKKIVGLCVMGSFDQILSVLMVPNVKKCQ